MDAQEYDRILELKEREIAALRSQLSTVEGERGAFRKRLHTAHGLNEGLTVCNTRQAETIQQYKEDLQKAESDRDTWLSAHDAIYAELQEVKKDRDKLEADRSGLWAALAETQEGWTASAAELLQVKGERDALADAIGRAVYGAGVARNVPMTGPELILMLDSLTTWVVSLRGERDRYREALEKLSASYKPGNMSIISLMGKIASDALHPATEAPK